MKQTDCFNPIGNQMVIFVLFIRKSFDINVLKPHDYNKRVIRYVDISKVIKLSGVLKAEY